MKTAFCSLLFLFVIVPLSQAQSQPSLQFRADGKFKIAQITDVHYIDTEVGAKRSLEMISEIIETEQPDLMIFTGDIVVNGDILKGWDEVLEPVIQRKTPWAAVFGNHDDEQKVSRREIMEHITKKPYCCASFGPKEVKGVGNYVLEIVDRKQNKPSFLMYCLDSNAYSTVKDVDGYGWFGFDQIAWYRAKSASYTKNNGGTPLSALAFFHIPLNEYSLMTALPEPGLVGTKGEKECPGAVNSGMFTAMLECGDVMGTFVGHDHDNDYIGKYNRICLAYGRFSGTETTYGPSTNGSRIIEIESDKRAFRTWIRLHHNNEIQEPIEYQW